MILLSNFSKHRFTLLLVAVTSLFSGHLLAEQEARTGQDQAPEDFSIHGQYTLTIQGKPRFDSPYEGKNSLSSHAEAREAETATLFLGARLWSGAELYFNPELSQGKGLSNTFGLGGYSNGEAQKGGTTLPKFYPARYFFKQVIGLGGEEERVEAGPNQLGGFQDISRLTLIGGAVAATDYFQTNSYANDPRGSFTNWSIWESAAWDVPGNSRGYTQGIYVELNQKEWALRYGSFAVPPTLNNTDLFFRGEKTLSHNLELEGRYSIANHTGKSRLLTFYTRAPMGNYRDALALQAAGMNIDDAMDRTRVVGHEKYGFALSVEQEITDQLGAFSRFSWSNSQYEDFGFTDADSSFAAGLSLKGGGWGRKGDTLGAGAAVNGINKGHQEFLAHGGATLLLGDGGLRYGNEELLELFYAAKLNKTFTLTGDFQVIRNPGYNQDRGPVTIFGLRLHADF
jgi:high affinity Mn2+ porin